MAAQQPGRVALMSIRPEFADRIMDGTKRVEFRKRPLAPDVSHVIIYSTAPVSAVVGAFAVDGQDITDPEELWAQFGEVAGISRERFAEYFEGCSVGTGIRVKDVVLRDRPGRLEELGIPRPPQSFQYLPARVATSALSAMMQGTSGGVRPGPMDATCS